VGEVDGDIELRRLSASGVGVGIASVYDVSGKPGTGGADNGKPGMGGTSLDIPSRPPTSCNELFEECRLIWIGAIGAVLGSLIGDRPPAAVISIVLAESLDLCRCRSSPDPRF
jgi:hypothetical protein